jgi:hypothetical protein
LQPEVFRTGISTAFQARAYWSLNLRSTSGFFSGRYVRWQQRRPSPPMPAQLVVVVAWSYWLR